MLRHSLVPHPDHPPRTVREVSVATEQAGYQVTLRYLVAEDAAVRWPEPARAARTDRLWQTTCFELFVRQGAAPAYTEFNFSPSTAWAAYDFSSYRSGMRDRTVQRPPAIVRAPDGATAIIDLVGFEPDAALQLAYTTVIEELDGTRSFWALAHPPGAPDFHHEACFAATLPAPNGA